MDEVVVGVAPVVVSGATVVVSAAAGASCGIPLVKKRN